MRRLIQFVLLLSALPLSAQVVIEGGTIIAGGNGSASCPTCALTNQANTFTQTNTFPNLTVTGGVNGLPIYENQGLFNIGLGVDSTPSTGSGTQNLGIGDGTLQVLTSGYDNTSIGVAANGSVTTGFENTSIGTFALQDVVTGGENTAVGSLALADALGNNNTAIGESALNDLVTGDNNTAIGYEAGCGTSCAADSGPNNAVSNGVYIGYLAAPSLNSLTNQILIGYNIQSSLSNYTQIGNSSTTAATIYGALTLPNLSGGGTGCVAVSNTGLLSSTSCGGGGGGVIFEVNGSALASATTVNFVGATGVVATNPSAGEVLMTGSFAGLPSGTNPNTLVISGSLAATGGGTITATTMPYSGLSGSVPTWNQNTTGTAAGLSGSPAITVSNVTDSGLTPGDCVQASTGGLLVTTGSACGAGGGSGPTVQTNGVNNASQTNLNFTNTATVTFANPSVGTETATVSTAATGTLGVSSPDNTTISAATGVYSVIKPANSTLLGFNSSGTYTGFTLGTNLSFASGVLNSAGIGGTLSTTNCIPKQTASTSVTCSAATDSGSTFAITDNLTVSGSGGITVTGTIPGVVELAAGTGTIPTLPANSYGDIGPVTGGTSYNRQHPNTAAAGVEVYGSPTTINGQPGIQSTFQHLEFPLSTGSGGWGEYGGNPPLAVFTAVNAGHIVKLDIAYGGGATCTTGPTVGVYDNTTRGFTVTGAITIQAVGTVTSTTGSQAYSAGDVITIAMDGGGNCGGAYTATATLQEP
jgi:hypothetical protein